MTIADLAFRVTIATADDLADIAALRGEAYGRHHLTGLAGTPARPDPADTAPGTVVLVARCKTTGQALGTARLQRNHPNPLAIEASQPLPPELARLPRAEITRLAIAQGAPAEVWAMLVKACYLTAIASQIRLLVIGARNAGLVRMYRRLGFADLRADGQMVPLAHAGNVPHRVLSFDVLAAERNWLAMQHPLYGFMVETWHPDLELIPLAAASVPAAAGARLPAATAPAAPAQAPAPVAPTREPLRQVWPLAA